MTNDEQQQLLKSLPLVDTQVPDRFVSYLIIIVLHHSHEYYSYSYSIEEDQSNLSSYE